MSKVFYNQSGYIGCSMSERASEAYASGEMPMSKWTKPVILECVEENYPEMLDAIAKYPLDILKEQLLVPTGWHHTGKFANKTTFYEFNEDIPIAELAELLKEAYKDKIYTQNKNSWLKGFIWDFGDERGEVVLWNQAYKKSPKIAKYPDFAQSLCNYNMHPYTQVGGYLPTMAKRREKYIGPDGQVHYFAEKLEELNSKIEKFFKRNNL